MAYLAIFYIAAGSSYGRADTKEKAIDICRKTAVRDWKSLFDLKGKEATLIIYEIDPEGEYWWDYQVHEEGARKIIPELERVVVTL